MCVIHYIEFVQSERNKNPEDRRANIDYYRPKSNSVFNLNCDIPGADLRQPVIWTKDGGPLDASKPDLLIVRNSGRTLGFPSILRNQAGVYSCRIGNNERVSIVDVRPEKVQGNNEICELRKNILKKCVKPSFIREQFLTNIRFSTVIG